MYNEKELTILKQLINKGIKEHYFKLDKAQTELTFLKVQIQEKGEEYKPHRDKMLDAIKEKTLGQFKEITLDKIKKIKDKLEVLSSLYLKTNALLDKRLDKNINNIESQEPERDEWELEP